VPIGLVNLVLASRVLPESQTSGRRFDYVSAILNTLVFGLLFTGVDVATHGGRVAVMLASGEFALAALAAVALIRREAPKASPLIPLDLMRIPVFALSVVASICAFMGQIMAFLTLPFYFEGVMHRSQVATGLLITPWPLAVGVAAPLAGRLSDKVPAAILGACGLTVFALGLASLAFLPAGATTLDIVWRMALCGLGFGFFQSPNNRTLLSSAPRERAGAAGGMLAMARLTGMTMGAALTAMVFRVWSTEAESACMTIGAGLALAAAAASLARLSTPSPRTAAST
jgi:DHA2 family multidrug resistance protein-like MFS transporter